MRRASVWAARSRPPQRRRGAQWLQEAGMPCSFSPEAGPSYSRAPREPRGVRSGLPVCPPSKSLLDEVRVRPQPDPPDGRLDHRQNLFDPLGDEIVELEARPDEA